jgi:hypothetical protein
MFLKLRIGVEKGGARVFVVGPKNKRTKYLKGSKVVLHK